MERRVPRVRGPRRKCSDCAHLKHDETWGECKCLKQQHRIHDPNMLILCEDYKKANKG